MLKLAAMRIALRMGLAAGLVVALGSAAQAAVYRNITVHGNERVETSTVLSYLDIKPGQDVSDTQLDAALKALYQTHFFKDIRFSRDGDQLMVEVKENPIINQIAFEGNSEIDDDTLKNETQLKPRAVFSANKVQDDVARIQQLYRRAGRLQAKIVPKIIQKEQNRLDLVYEIHEGAESVIRRIAFIGNKHFNATTLRDQLFTSENAWWSFIFGNDNYDADRLKADEEKLRRFYLSKGYADFQVKHTSAELGPDQESFFITFTIDEGARYNFGKLEVKSELPKIDLKPLRKKLLMDSGDVYNAELVEQSIDEMTTDLHEQNQPFVQIDPQVRRNIKARTIDMQFTLKAAPKQYVRQINITGNTRTKDNVIRREFPLAEGDPLNATKLQRAQKNLKDLDYFGKADVKTTPVPNSPDQQDVNVKVEEKSTGNLQLGGGYSTTDGVGANFSISEKNLLGKGQILALSTSLNQRRQNYNLGFTEPYFLNRKLSAGVDLFNTRYDNQQFSDYQEEQTGAGVRFGYEYTPRLSQLFNYRFQSNKINNVGADASRFLKEQEGQRYVGNIGSTLTYDRRDSKVDPTKGYKLSWNVNFAGLGGNVKYISNVANASYYIPVNEKVSWLNFAEGGYITGWDGDPVRINNRFYIGGDTLRGFRAGGIGPRDTSTNDALGGKQYYRGTTELSTVIADDLGIKGHLFGDVGSLWNDGITDPNVKDINSPRVAAGVGLSWKSPFGPIRVDLAKPIVKEEFDETQAFRFSFGTRF